MIGGDSGPFLLAIGACVFLVAFGALGMFTEDTQPKAPVSAEDEVTLEDVERLREEDAVTYKYQVRKYEVIDGDTVRCTLDLGFKVFKEVDVRIQGINTPEKRGHEKTAGIPVTDVVKRYLEQFTDDELIVVSMDWGKYANRTIGDIIPKRDGAMQLSAYLLNNGLAQHYGQPKFTDDELTQIRDRAQQILDK